MKLYRDMIQEIVKDHGDKTAVICSRQSGITHARINSTANAIIAGLTAMGLKKGDTIALYAANTYHYRVLFWVAGKSGFVLVPVNGRFKPKEAAYVINDSEAKCLFVSKEFESQVNGIKEELTGVDHFLGLDSGMDGFEDLDQWVKSFPDAEPETDIAEDDLVWLQYTSGTTGFPKGAMLTQKNACMLGRLGMAALQKLGKFTGETRFLQCVPCYTFGGSGWDILIQHVGATAVLMDRFTPEEMMAMVEEHRITDTHIVPVMLSMLLDSDRFGQYDMSSLKAVTIGAAPLPPELIQKAIEKIGPIFIQDFGASELGLVTLLDYKDVDMNIDSPTRNRLESCGIPVDGVDAGILDENGNEVGSGEIGELAVKSPMVMKGYWKNPEATQKAFKNGRYLTGDMCLRDKDGYIYIKDRQKDMIISGGFNIYPKEIEKELVRHPAVTDAAVFGIPDDKWGESVCAYVICSGPVTEKELIEFVSQSLSNYKKPKKIVFVDTLPRNVSGKVLKKELRAPYWQGRDKQV